MDNSSTFICGRSALEIYRSPADGARLARLLNQEQSRLASPCTQSGCNVTPQAPRRDLASALAEMFGVPLPLEALVCEPGRRRLSTYTRTVLDTDPFHLAAFIEIERGVFVARPELVYYQLTKGATIARAWMLASELCGRYALDSHAETGMRKPPAADVAGSPGVILPPVALVPLAIRHEPRDRAHEAGRALAERSRARRAHSTAAEDGRARNPRRDA